MIKVISAHEKKIKSFMACGYGIIMNVECVMLKAGSGSDTYTERLSCGLQTHGHVVTIRKYPRFLQSTPFLIPYAPGSNTDVVHANLDHASFLKRSRFPLLVTAHHITDGSIIESNASAGYRLYIKYRRRFIKKALIEADRVVAVSNYTKQMIEHEFDHKDLVVIHNGIDTSTFSPITVKDDYPNYFKLLFVGNTTYRKGFDTILRIAESLDDRFRVFIVAGLRGSKALKLNNCIFLNGLSKDNLIKTYNMADLLICPSRLEGFGYSVAEAMSCGKPIIAADNSSLPELVDHQRGGYLCSTEDVDQYVDRIYDLYSSPEKRIEMSKYNRNKCVSQFNIDAMAGKYDRLLKEMV